MSISIGINGLGRIGKLLLLQMLDCKYFHFEIKAINATKLDAEDFEDYLEHDSVHRLPKKHQFIVIDKNTLKINGHMVRLFQERDPKNIDWVSAGVEYLIDCTGAFLTEEKCKNHNAPYTIISSPAKDKMPTFIFGVNEDQYEGEKIVSGSSCTTNCLAPMLRLLNDNFGVENCVFTTIHAATNSQYVTDVIQKGARTDRSVFNNIIPHTTGASSSVTAVLPSLKGKVFGTSVRVPVSNCSLVDLNVTLTREDVTLDTIREAMYTSKHRTIFTVTRGKRVSCDYLTTEEPCNLDYTASMDMGKGNFKLFLWYDNEWSYCSQLMWLTFTMYCKNEERKKQEKFVNRFVGNMDLLNKGVVCRFDFNVPIDKNNNISDDFRIASTVETVNLIRNKGAKYIVLASHFGRPEGREMKYSTEFMIPTLEKYYGERVKFLPHGLSTDSIQRITAEPEGIYLLENLRFHKEETLYEKNCIACFESLCKYAELGDIFISDAFGCAHRKHLSIHGISMIDKEYGYGCLIQKEVNSLSSLDPSKKVLAVIGGNKIKDKLPIIDTLKKLSNATVFVAGGLARQYERKETDKNVVVMEDGYGSHSLDGETEYIPFISDDTVPYVLDAGKEALEKLQKLANDAEVIFWNGSLGKIEDPRYKKGSDAFANYLISEECTNKSIIIGGGETASLFDKELIKERQNIYVSTGGGALLEYLQENIIYNSTLVGLKIFKNGC